MTVCFGSFPACGAGDWNDADPIAIALVKAVTDACIAEGFRAELHPPGFVEFLRQQGIKPSQDFKLLTATVSA